MQRQVKHQALCTDQDQFTGRPLQLEGTAEVLVGVGGKLDELLIQLRGQAETDVHQVARLVHRADDLQQSLKRASDRFNVQLKIIERIHQDRKFFIFCLKIPQYDCLCIFQIDLICTP